MTTLLALAGINPERLPADLPKVEGMPAWLQYVTERIFRVAELNACFSEMRAAGYIGLGSGLGGRDKRYKVELLKTLLAKDARSFADVSGGDPPPPECASYAIPPGLIVKAIYLHTVTVGKGFRPAIQNSLFKDTLIDLINKQAHGRPDMMLGCRVVAGGDGEMQVQRDESNPLKVKLVKAEPRESVSAPAATEISCVCGTTHNNLAGGLIQCQGYKCGRLQHYACTYGRMEHMNKSKRLPFCFQCRALMSDPFVEKIENSILNYSTSVIMQTAMATGRVKQFRRGFHLPRSLYNSLYGRPEDRVYALVTCIHVGDEVVNRTNWPIGAQIMLNGHMLRFSNRNLTKELTKNTRDLMVDISKFLKCGQNNLWMDSRDARTFVLVFQFYRRRTMGNVVSLVHEMQSGDADLAKEAGRFKSLLRSRGDEIAATSLVISLKCVLSGQRLKQPIRSAACRHAKVFDLESFLQMVEKTKKWQCPHCMAPITILDLKVDQYVKRILDELDGHRNLLEVEINPQGQWRPYVKAGDGGAWFEITEAFTPAIGCDGAAQAGVEENDATEGKATAAGAADGADAGDEESSEFEELSEAEELRRAVLASGIAPRPKPAPEVIVLSDSDEDNPIQPASSHYASTSTSFNLAFPRGYKRPRYPAPGPARNNAPPGSLRLGGTSLNFHNGLAPDQAAQLSGKRPRVHVGGQPAPPIPDGEREDWESEREHIQGLLGSGFSAFGGVPTIPGSNGVIDLDP